MKWILIIALSFASMVRAESLFVERGSQKIQVLQRQQEIHYKQSPVAQRIKIEPCHRAQFEKFWRTTQENFGKLPKKSLFKRAHGKVMFDGRERVLDSYTSGSRKAVEYFDRLPQIILNLTVRAQEKCKV